MVHVSDSISGNCVRLMLVRWSLYKWVYLHHIFVVVENSFVEQIGQTALHCSLQRILKLAINFFHNTVHNFKAYHFSNLSIYKRIFMSALIVTITLGLTLALNSLQDHLFQTVSYSGQVKLKLQDIYSQRESDKLHLLCMFYWAIYLGFYGCV